LAPVNATWGLENRTVAIRVKGLAGAGLHAENRVPCGASNPYLVGAAAIAADWRSVSRLADIERGRAFLGEPGVGDDIACRAAAWRQERAERAAHRHRDAAAAFSSWRWSVPSGRPSGPEQDSGPGRSAGLQRALLGGGRVHRDRRAHRQ
jgi:hypothetical protein